MTLNLKTQIFFIFTLFVSNCFSQTYQLVWNDEFNGKGLPDPTKWFYEEGWLRNNNELQCYTRSSKNLRQRNGCLEITVRKEPKQGTDYTSASIITANKADWTYGKIEGRFKVPQSKGLWACFWTLGSSIREEGWPACGEIDIFEHINNESVIHATGHWADDSLKHVKKSSDSPQLDVTKWHTYSVIWSPNRIKWYVDDVQFHEISIADGINSTQEFHKPHYILINLPIGGTWPGSPDETTVLPATMYCDYVRIYKMEN
jgi:beta-glucanase (GH16 family)